MVPFRMALSYAGDSPTAPTLTFFDAQGAPPPRSAATGRYPTRRPTIPILAPSLRYPSCPVPPASWDRRLRRQDRKGAVAEELPDGHPGVDQRLRNPGPCSAHRPTSTNRSTADGNGGPIVVPQDGTQAGTPMVPTAPGSRYCPGLQKFGGAGKLELLNCTHREVRTCCGACRFPRLARIGHLRPGRRGALWRPASTSPDGRIIWMQPSRFTW